MNQMYNDRIKQFEKDLLSKSSTEVTFKKQMETVSAHAKRMVDENRKLKEQLKNSMNAKDEIVKLKTEEMKGMYQSRGKRGGRKF